MIAAYVLAQYLSYFFLFSLLGLCRQLAGMVEHLGYLVIEELGMHSPSAGAYLRHHASTLSVEIV